jgi:hypothetical protein
VCKVIAFSGLAAALVFCAWREIDVALAGSPHLAAGEMLFAGGVFTLAIAAVIRD